MFGNSNSGSNDSKSLRQTTVIDEGFVREARQPVKGVDTTGHGGSRVKSKKASRSFICGCGCRRTPNCGSRLFSFLIRTEHLCKPSKLVPLKSIWEIGTYIPLLLRCWRTTFLLLGWPKSSFGFFHNGFSITEKPERPFQPTQYLYCTLPKT